MANLEPGSSGVFRWMIAAATLTVAIVRLLD